MTRVFPQTPMSALERRERSWLRRLPTRVARLRLGVQLLILAVLLAPLWWSWLRPDSAFYQGNFAASRLRLGSWSLRLADPFTALSTWAAARTLPGSLAAGAVLVGAAFLMVRSRAFCSFACPLHLVLEHWDKFLEKTSLHRGPVADPWPRWTSGLIAVLLVIAAGVVRMPVFEALNPINALVRALQHLTFAGLGLVAAVMALELLVGRRVFCRRLCPIGGFYASTNGLGMTTVAVDPSRCTGCRRCAAACLAAPELFEAIDEARSAGQTAAAPVRSPHCTLCCDCAAQCEEDAIVFRVGRSRRGMRPAQGLALADAADARSARGHSREPSTLLFRNTVSPVQG